MLYGPYVKFYDTDAQAVVDLAPSPAIAGMIARLDGAVPFGFADSVSNNVVKGITGTNRMMDYAEGKDSEARRLRNLGVNTICKDVGWRSYGHQTTDIDPIWHSLPRVRSLL